MQPREVAHRRLAARSPAGLRLHAGGPAHPDGADGHDRPGSRRLDGQRHADLGAVRQAEAALHLFQAELRAGDQPADRSDPRGAGDVASSPSSGRGRTCSTSKALSRHKRLEVRQPILTNEDLEKIRSIGHIEDAVRHQDARHHLSGRQGRERAWTPRSTRLCERAEAAVHGGYNIIILSDRQVGPDRIADPGAARDRRGASSPDPQGPAHLGRPRGRDRRAARGASFLLPRRLRRRGDQSLSRVRDADRHEGRAPREARRQGGRQALHQVDRQGHAEGDVQDGHLDLPVLLRRADLRRRRPAQASSSTSTSPAPRPRSRASGSTRSPRRPRAAIASAFGDSPVLRHALEVGGEYLFRMRGEAHAWSPESVATLQHAVRGNSLDKYRAFAQLINEQAERFLTIRGLFRIKSAAEDGRAAGADRGGRARQGDRQALRHRRHVVRLDLARGAHHARHRHEPDRRQVEHRRGRRGIGPLQAAAERRFHALGDQAGGVGPLRRHHRISRQFRHDADQDGAGRKARRRRPAARPQGRRDHRQGAPLDAGRRPDLAAAAPRHLFDRGSGAAHLRPEERQPDGRRVGEARLRGRRRHGRGRRLQGARRPRDDLGLRGRHRRLAADLDQARGLARGRSASPRPTRRWCATACAAASPCRSTAACAPAATSSSARCSAPTSSASRPRR